MSQASIPSACPVRRTSIRPQTWAQAPQILHHSAIILTMSPVYAAFFALLLNSERLTASMVAGATLMVAASFLVELPPQAGRKDSLDPKVADEVPS